MMSWDAEAKAELSRWAAIPASEIGPFYVSYRRTVVYRMSGVLHQWRQAGFVFQDAEGTDRVGNRGSKLGNLFSFDHRDLEQTLRLSSTPDGVEMTIRISTRFQIWTVGNHVDVLLEIAEVMAHLHRGPEPTEGRAARTDLGWRHGADWRAASRFWKPDARPAYR
ncbi:hypothetical protein EON79_10770 [bacterium]|nr:MAG: hypothetical protein EON79_10770 [bacterium]